MAIDLCVVCNLSDIGDPLVISSHIGACSELAKERDPGGRPPYGFRSNAAKLLEPEPERLPTVRRVFELAAAGLPDRDAAAAVELPLFTVRGILTSPLYVGRLRDGEPARWAPLVPGGHWETTQAARARRATNTSRPADPRRPYALDMLHCAACGKRLTGDTGYYRHREPCPPFIAARSEHHGRGRTLGHACRRELYEQIIEDLLAEASVGASAIASVVAEVNRSPSTPDHSELDRIARERERAMSRYLQDRDGEARDGDRPGKGRSPSPRRFTGALPGRALSLGGATRDFGEARRSRGRTSAAGRSASGWSGPSGSSDPRAGVRAEGSAPRESGTVPTGSPRTSVESGGSAADCRTSVRHTTGSAAPDAGWSDSGTAPHDG
jgi:hypothetical protein